LNDHLAGSVAAVALIDDLAQSDIDLGLKEVLARLKREINEEQQVLRKVMSECSIREESVKKAMAWLGEKLSRWKIGSKTPDGNCLPLMMGLEVLCLGITGKLLGWRVLAVVFGPKLSSLGINIEQLEHRAAAQRDLVERHRLAYAVKTFGSAGVPVFP
jgi:hypothetical protein